ARFRRLRPRLVGTPSRPRAPRSPARPGPTSPWYASLARTLAARCRRHGRKSPRRACGRLPMHPSRDPGYLSADGQGVATETGACDRTRARSGCACDAPVLAPGRRARPRGHARRGSDRARGRSRDDGRLPRSAVRLLRRVGADGDAGARRALRQDGHAPRRGPRPAVRRPRLGSRAPPAPRGGAAGPLLPGDRHPLPQPGRGEHRLGLRRLPAVAGGVRARRGRGPTARRPRLARGRRRDRRGRAGGGGRGRHGHTVGLPRPHRRPARQGRAHRARRVGGRARDPAIGPGGPTVTRVLATARHALIAIGAGASAYLTYVHFADDRVACPTSGCERVQESFYATPHGLPLSLAGLLLFVALAALAASRGAGARTAEAGIAVGGAVVAVYLIGVQVAALGATCPWCLAADASLIGLAALAVARLGAEARRAGTVDG